MKYARFVELAQKDVDRLKAYTRYMTSNDFDHSIGKQFSFSNEIYEMRWLVDGAYKMDEWGRNIKIPKHLLEKEPEFSALYSLLNQHIDITDFKFWWFCRRYVVYNKKPTIEYGEGGSYKVYKTKSIHLITVYDYIKKIIGIAE